MHNKKKGLIFSPVYRAIAPRLCKPNMRHRHLLFMATFEPLRITADHGWPLSLVSANGTPKIAASGTRKSASPGNTQISTTALVDRCDGPRRAEGARRVGRQQCPGRCKSRDFFALAVH